MEDDEVEFILEKYGLDRILEDAQMTLVDVLSLMNELGYVYLDQYEEEE